MTQSMPLSTLQALSVHLYADEFPYVSDDDILELAQDIETNGLIHPIVLFQNEILDGRNRLRALAKTNLVNAPVEEFEGTEIAAVEYIDSLNILRRHMTDAQRLVVAMARLPYEERDARDRMSEGGKGGSTDPTLSDQSGQRSRDIVAEKFGLSGASVQRGKVLFVAEARDEHGIATRYVPVAGAEDVVAEIKAGKITSVSGAVNEYKTRNNITDGSKVKPEPAPEYGVTTGADTGWDPEQGLSYEQKRATATEALIRSARHLAATITRYALTDGDIADATEALTADEATLLADFFGAL